MELWTSSPCQYQIWKGRPVEVTNKNEADLCGRLAIAGYAKELWDLRPPSLPPNAKQGKIVSGFYQVFKEHVPLMDDLNRYLTDSSNPSFNLPVLPRRRVVILIEVEKPSFLKNVDRFRKRKVALVPAILPAGENDVVPPGEGEQHTG